jgi:hypothetical protein
MLMRRDLGHIPYYGTGKSIESFGQMDRKTLPFGLNLFGECHDRNSIANLTLYCFSDGSVSVFAP